MKLSLSFRLILPKGSPEAVMLVAPSVTPKRAKLTEEIVKQARNPGLRAIKYDTSTFTILDIEQYYINLDEANSIGEATWKLEYSMANEYGLQNITAESINELIGKFKADDNLFQVMFSFTTLNESFRIYRNLEEMHNRYFISLN